MSVSLTLHQVSTPSTVDGGASYQVLNEVTGSVGIEPAVFVFKTDTGVFDHYATPADMEILPNTQELAVANGAQFYRQPSVTRVWTTISAMNEDLAVTRSRLRSLVRETTKIQGATTIDQVTEITAD